MGKIEYKIGEKINGIEYIGNETIANKARKADFICGCGKLFHTYINFVIRGHTKSCGCLKSLPYHFKHGGCSNGISSPEYKCWQHMKARCYDIKDKAYPNYGGRGITVCDRWLESFDNFFEDMGEKPTKKHSLDRYPNNESGIYEKSNCRWATPKQQTRNQRTNRWIVYDNRTMIMKDWATELGITAPTLCKYLKRHPFEDAYNRFSKRLCA